MTSFFDKPENLKWLLKMVLLTFLFLFMVWLVWCYFNFQIVYLEVKNE